MHVADKEVDGGAAFPLRVQLVDRARSSGGHGVGLAIAQAAVQAHGGTLTAASRDGGGLCVLLSLPAARL